MNLLLENSCLKYVDYRPIKGLKALGIFWNVFIHKFVTPFGTVSCSIEWVRFYVHQIVDSTRLF